ncbi:YjzD family protein [Lederbergia lenta]|uniref:DeoR family transcriptional regulator n=1 Tax=Lederbergia lenta TaxID=1467 RepID=A0A2X4Z917_LEDLE|nr:YjzD family protein [Lederbergia lenta]MCM3110462.1 YjzD family protein [Lederbergia lenta]MEC2323972.1 YjzD family protein [Lederbergia lenta]SQI60885.1 DeoR family transcriptional regulator [Lederbergia lenta]
MKYFWTLVWGFILTHVLAYVANSMLGLPYEFKSASILAIGVIILLYFAAAALYVDPSKKQHS